MLYISTSVWSAQHPNTGRNIQHLLLDRSNFILALVLKAELYENIWHLFKDTFNCAALMSFGNKSLKKQNLMHLAVLHVHKIEIGCIWQCCMYTKSKCYALAARQSPKKKFMHLTTWQSHIRFLRLGIKSLVGQGQEFIIRQLSFFRL